MCGNIKVPTELKDPNVFTIEGKFLKFFKVAPKATAVKMKKRLSRYSSVVKSLEYKNNFKKKPPHGWKTDLECQVKHEIPGSQRFGACNAILSTGLWLAEAEIELGGRKSNAHVAR